MHVDMDCFFAAVEERENPALKGKPVIVGSDPKAGAGRGIVATCNYEARRYGLKSAMPISIAYRRCPDGIYLRPRFSLYSAESRKIMALLRERSNILEPAGIDEAYLDVSGRKTFEAALELAREIQTRIREGQGLSASIGVGPNKLVAKIASDHRKPGGVTVVIPSRVHEFLDPKSVSALRGVGPVTKDHLLRMGCETVGRLRELPEERLVAEFGKFGHYLWREANGRDDSPVDPYWIAKSIGREHTFEVDSADAETVKRTLLDCVEEVHREMTAEGHWCRTLTVKVRFSGYETHSRQKTLRLSAGSLEQLASGASTLLEPFLATRRRFRLVGFSVSNLAPPEDLLPLQ